MLTSHCRFVSQVSSQWCGTGLITPPWGRCWAIDDRDSGQRLPQYTPRTHAEAGALFQLFEMERFDEVEQDGQTALGERKHWHLFHIVARKR